MSRFYASIQGGRGEATRQGHSGITGHVRGWQSGVQVDGRIEDGEDAFDVYATSGSGYDGRRTFVGTVRVIDGEPTFTPAEVLATV